MNTRGLSVTSLSLGTIPSSCGPLYAPHTCQVYGVCQFCCNQLYSLLVVFPRLICCPQRCLSALCVSLSLLPRSVSDYRLVFSCWLLSFQPLFFSLHPLTYLSPTVISSYLQPLEQASLSLHLSGLSFSLVSASIPQPAYLASPRWPSPLHAGAGFFPAGAPVWQYICSIVFLVSHCIPIAGVH